MLAPALTLGSGFTTIFIEALLLPQEFVVITE
jgi:hypothetical protein